jgi:hypothetical protein
MIFFFSAEEATTTATTGLSLLLIDLLTGFAADVRKCGLAPTALLALLASEKATEKFGEYGLFLFWELRHDCSR